MSCLPLAGRLADARWAETQRAPHGAKLAPFSCPLGPRLVIQPMLDPCHPAERLLGLAAGLLPALLTPM
jgi:hypothetical protein